MPFGLKNARATYQRLISKIFLRLMGETVKAYIDDMVLKSQRAQNYIGDATEVFEVFRKFWMKLNPSKCAFGVSSGQFLGHIVSKRGIEPSPTKVKTLSQIQEISIETQLSGTKN